MKFTYEAIHAASKERTSGEITANSQEDVVSQLTGQGWQIISIAEIAEKKSFSFGGGKISGNDKANLVNHLAVLIEAGVTMPEAMRVLAEETKSTRLKFILEQSKVAVESGQPLSRAWANFPDLIDQTLLSLIQAGEASGNLTKILRNLGDKFRSDIELKNQVVGALMYPSIVLLALIGMGIGMMIFVVPKLADTFAKMKLDLPIQTKILIGLSNLFSQHLILTLTVIIVLSAAGYYFFQSKAVAGIRTTIIKRLPFLNKIAKNFDFVRLTSALEILVSAGIPITKTLEITSDSVSNVQIKAALRQAAKDVTKGITLSQSLSNHPKLFPGIITSIIKVGEESGTLDKAMTELKSFFEAELKNQLRIFSSMIEPILTLFIGVVIAFAVLSLISPIYQIVGDVSKG